MSFTRSTSVRVLGHEVFKIEREMTFRGGKERSVGTQTERRLPQTLDINTDYLVPVLIEAAKSLFGLVPSQIGFFEARIPLEAEADIDAEIACSELRNQYGLTQEDVERVVFGMAAQTDLLESQNRDLASAYRGHIRAALEKSWPKGV